MLPDIKCVAFDGVLKLPGDALSNFNVWNVHCCTYEKTGKKQKQHWQNNKAWQANRVSVDTKNRKSVKFQQQKSKPKHKDTHDYTQAQHNSGVLSN